MHLNFLIFLRVGTIIIYFFNIIILLLRFLICGFFLGTGVFFFFNRISHSRFFGLESAGGGGGGVWVKGEGVQGEEVFFFLRGSGLCFCLVGWGGGGGGCGFGSRESSCPAMSFRFARPIRIQRKLSHCFEFIEKNLGSAIFFLGFFVFVFVFCFLIINKVKLNKSRSKILVQPKNRMLVPPKKKN